MTSLPTLLVVEDSPKIIPFYKELLPRIGFQPVFKTNLADALEALAKPENAFTGVITDGLNEGWKEVQMAALARGLKTAVISTRHDIDNLIRHLHLENTVYFYKPELANLLPQIKEFFDEGSSAGPEKRF